MTKKKIDICFGLTGKNINNEKYMGKENIVNDYWICRTIMGTIALEEETSLKTRNFLYQIVTPKKLSDVFRNLNETMPMEFYDLADFYNELNHCLGQFWVEKVDEPQINTDPTISVEDIDIPDSWGIFAVTQSIKEKSKSGTDSDVSETLFDDFGNPKATANDLKYWLEQEKQEQLENNDAKKVEFKTDKEEIIFNYGITDGFGFKQSDNVEEIPELPEENPFFKDGNIPTNLGHEFEIPINDEAKRMLEMFKDTTLSDFENKAQKKDEEFFSAGVSSQDYIENTDIDVEIGSPIQQIEKNNTRINASGTMSNHKSGNKSKIKNSTSKNKKVVQKKTFFEKLLSVFKK